MIVVHGVRPFYWGLEQDARHDPKKVSRAWLIEIEPPYRKSVFAVRVRFGNRAFHFGLCKRVKPEQAINMIGRNLEDTTPDQISEWWNGVDDLQSFIEEQMEDPEFAKAYREAQERNQ